MSESVVEIGYQSCGLSIFDKVWSWSNGLLLKWCSDNSTGVVCVYQVSVTAVEWCMLAYVKQSLKGAIKSGDIMIIFLLWLVSSAGKLGAWAH